MKRKRRLYTGFFTLFLLAGGLWLWAQQRQSALNRALIAALRQRDAKNAITLISQGADPNARERPTPLPTLIQLMDQLLHRSAPPLENGHTAFMIACGAAWDENGILFYASLNDGDWSRLIQTMVQHGANVNAPGGTWGWTPLMGVVVSHRLETVRLLLEHGAIVNAHDKTGKTPLYLAIDNGADQSLIAELLAHGANPGLADENGKTPWLLVKRRHLSAAAALFKQASKRNTE